MSPDSMTVRLKLRRIRVVEVVSDETERLEVSVKDLRSVLKCPWCGFKTTKVHDVRRVRVSDLPVIGAKSTLIWLRRRFSCDNCGERHLEDHPAFEGRMTRRLARAILRDARQLSITEIARRYGFSWSTIMALVKTWSERVSAHRRKKRLTGDFHMARDIPKRRKRSHSPSSVGSTLGVENEISVRVAAE